MEKIKEKGMTCPVGWGGHGTPTDSITKTLIEENCFSEGKFKYSLAIKKGISRFSSAAQSRPTLCVGLDSVTQWAAARQASLSIANTLSLLKLMSIELVMPSNGLILCIIHDRKGSGNKRSAHEVGTGRFGE